MHRTALSLLLCLLCAPAASATELAARMAAKNSVTTDEIETHAAALSDDTFEGREAGSRGGRAAAGYLVEQFEKFGLEPAGKSDGFTQTFNGSMRNLLGKLPGSDGQLSEEVILIGAHYDHVGYGTRSNSFGPLGKIHNGADDNASGVSSLLEAAQALALLKGSHKRTILFALWDGEEKGLLGSQHWLTQPTLPRANVRCAINLDMVGRLRDDKLEVYGVRTSRDLRRRISRLNGADDLTLDFLWRMQEDSDHYNFFRYSIPTLMFHTGKHDDYHRPSDDVEKLNISGVQSITRLLVDLAIDLADADDLQGFRSESGREGRDERDRQLLEQPLPDVPNRLGITWLDGDVSERGVVVASVYRRRAAMLAGIIAGDRIVAVNGKPIASESRFQSLISTETQVQLSIAPRDGGAQRDVKVTLEGDPVRVGITWIRDEAEPHCVLVKRTFPSSPAARAGLEPADRIYAINDAEFASDEEFETLLMAGDKPLNLTVERRGKMLTIPLDLDVAQ
jgi:Zn-dependent M28 family amino/carboxypeptidase